ncbi:ASPIC/UnbV domain-containing protein [Candidatus Poribacteria bacterium]|nr:ASPIC/UnbV domain-containing protein [Candidatus Poribacteria bacterium]
MTYLDYDLDGDLDVVVVGHRQQAIFLRNDYGQKNHWLHVALEGTKSNRQGVGARLTVRAGSQKQIREVRAGGGFLQSHSVPEAFGLGLATKVDELTVRWPSGIVHTLKDVPVNQTIRLVEPERQSLSSVSSVSK